MTGMNLTAFAFAAMATVTTGFIFATLMRETQCGSQTPAPGGDTSLGRNSVHWLAATAFIGALFICYFMR